MKHCIITEELFANARSDDGGKNWHIGEQKKMFVARDENKSEIYHGEDWEKMQERLWEKGYSCTVFLRSGQKEDLKIFLCQKFKGYRYVGYNGGDLLAIVLADSETEAFNMLRDRIDKRFTNVTFTIDDLIELDPLVKQTLLFEYQGGYPRDD